MHERNIKYEWSISREACGTKSCIWNLSGSPQLLDTIQIKAQWRVDLKSSSLRPESSVEPQRKIILF